MNQAGTPLIVARDVSKSYGLGHTSVRAVADVDLAIEKGAVVAVMGPSGCGKSTLLHLLGGLDTPDSGTVSVDGTSWSAVRPGDNTAYRRSTCGYVFQNLMLLPTATAAENVEVPLLLDGIPAPERRVRVAEMLDAVDLEGVGGHLPDELSGGQQQRVGIARALVHRPRLVLADEPTGSLDSYTAQSITRVLVASAQRQGATVILVTHDPAVAMHADRVLTMHSGRIDHDSHAVAETGTGTGTIAATSGDGQ